MLLSPRFFQIAIQPRAGYQQQSQLQFWPLVQTNMSLPFPPGSREEEAELPDSRSAGIVNHDHVDKAALWRLQFHTLLQSNKLTPSSTGTSAGTLKHKGNFFPEFLWKAQPTAKSLAFLPLSSCCPPISPYKTSGNAWTNHRNYIFGQKNEGFFSKRVPQWTQWVQKNLASGAI